MQVTETATEGLKREFKVVIAAQDIDEKMEHRLKELGGTVRIPGFRPGKVPMQLLKQRYGKSLLGEILERAVGDSSSQAMSERGLRPAMQPKIEITSFDQGKDLEYTMAIELLPDIEPMDFSKLELERLAVEVADEEVEDTLVRLAESQKKTEPLKSPRKSATGDVLVIDFKGSVDGEELPGMAGEDHHLELGSNQFIAGFEDQLIGMDSNETREITVTFPKDYGNDRLAGQDAIFVVTVKDILAAVPATIDDEFAKAVGEENLDALKAKVRERIGLEYRNIARARLKRKLLDQLADTHEFPVPEGMVDIEFDTIWKQVEEDKKKGQIDPEDADKDDDELQGEYREIAARRVRLGLLLSEVGRMNNIEVSEEELNRGLFQEAQRYPGQEREVFEHYQKTQGAMENLRAPIFEDKVIDFIVDLAKVNERRVSPDQLREEVAAEEEALKSGPKKKAAKKAAGKKSSAKESSGKKTAGKESAGSSKKKKTDKAESKS